MNVLQLRTNNSNYVINKDYFESVIQTASPLSCPVSALPILPTKPEVYPGKCWAFRGSYGSVTIALSRSVRITHVTMEHLPKSLSPTGEIDSAPQDFGVYVSYST